MPIAEPRIRRATVEDAAAIARVRVDTWRSAYRGILPDELLDRLDPAESAVRWRRGLETLNPDRVAYVADAGGAIVGFATGGPERSANRAYPGEVYALYVLDRHQGRGIGRALVRAAAEELVRRGLAPILIWTLRDNAKARTWYEGLGGVLVGEKSEPYEGHVLNEVGYGWRDPAALIGAPAR